jgi:hypothetical protein
MSHEHDYPQNLFQSILYKIIQFETEYGPIDHKETKDAQ